LEWPHYDWLGRYFAQTFNLVFLLLSAFLIGSKWGNESYCKLSISFIRKRILRLMTTFYPFLVIAIPILWIMGYNLSAKTIISQFLFLSWFSSLPCFGQLWYLTMIVICYIICWGISRTVWMQKLLSGKLGRIYLYMFLAIAVSLITICTLYIFPGSIILYAVLYAFIFVNSSTLIHRVHELAFSKWLLFGVLFNSFALYLYYNGLFEYRNFELSCINIDSYHHDLV